MKRYIDQGWEQRRRGRRWLTTRRGTHLRSIIGIVLGETGAIGARGGCYRGGGIRARHGYPLSSRLLLEGEARRSSFSKTRCLVMDLAHYRPTASFSKRFTFTPRRALFSNCSPSSLTERRKRDVRAPRHIPHLSRAAMRLYLTALGTLNLRLPSVTSDQVNCGNWRSRGGKEFFFFFESGHGWEKTRVYI